MGQWTEQAKWVGPSPNVSGPMAQQRGMVLHVMEGTLPGSISWGKNPASGVSFHFGTSKTGVCQQLVDTSITAWTQGAGNGSWVSVENEDYSGNPLSSPQFEAVAQLYARGVREYRWPYRLADSPSDTGLGYHGMGGAAWGGHPLCPGQPIVDQRQALLERAYEINNPAPIPPEPPAPEDDMPAITPIGTFQVNKPNPHDGIYYAWITADGLDVVYANVGNSALLGALKEKGFATPPATVTSMDQIGTPAEYLQGAVE